MQFRQEKEHKDQLLGPEIARLGLPCEGLGAEKFVPSLRKFVFLGFRGRVPSHLTPLLHVDVASRIERPKVSRLK